MDPFITLQHLLPRHALTRLVGLLAKSERRWIAQPFIRQFQQAYGISLDEAEVKTPDAFPSFNAFFTRALEQDARPIDGDDTVLVSPADGVVSQCGPIEQGQLFQAKGKRYSFAELTGADAADVATFEGGRFATVYLAPSDYHRVHAPLGGTLTESRAIPGTLFSVNGRTEEGIANLFCRNERLVLCFETANGPLLLVLVGALIVGSIETVVAGPSSPYRRKESYRYNEVIERGAEVGRFLLGSTAIVCTTAEAAPWGESLSVGQKVRVRQGL